ncbi:MAG: NFACT RNA binding domain-containing protein, partial [Bacteroidota bacterium]
FDIYIGKNARANDELLRKYAFKEDLWLHAKDVSGSHVLVKHKAAKPFGAPVIEKAAQLAAYYSKRKNDTLCPVIYTPRKFVRKRKNDPPGAVVVEKEKVLLVEPVKP